MILANDVAPVLKDGNDHDEAAGEAASTPAVGKSQFADKRPPQCYV